MRLLRDDGWMDGWVERERGRCGEDFNETMGIMTDQERLWKRDTDENEGAYLLPVDEQQRKLLHFTDGLTEWLVTLGGFIRSITCFYCFLSFILPYHRKKDGNRDGPVIS